MLAANAYTTDELIRLASVDDRYKPLLAERVLQEDSRDDYTTRERVQQLESRMEDLQDCALGVMEQVDWLADLKAASKELAFALETGATSAIHSARKKINQVRQQIAEHHAD